MAGANVLWVGENQPSDRPAVEPADSTVGGLAAIDRRKRDGGRFDAVVAALPPTGGGGALFEHARESWSDVGCYLYGRFEAEPTTGTAVCDVVSSGRVEPAELLDRLVAGAGRLQRPYPLPEAEPDRLAVVNELGVETGTFDGRAGALAAEVDAPMAAVSLVGDHVQRVVGLSGIGAAAVPELPRDEGVCTYTLLADSEVAITDLETDPRTRASAIPSRLSLRAYLGRPVTVAGHAVGTVALFDARPREFSRDERAAVREYVAGIEAELAARRAGRSTSPTRAEN